LAVATGQIEKAQTIQTYIVRNRGDGLRGSIDPKSNPAAGRAITHIKPIKPIGARCTLLECTLETGRTHQIRIHLSEIGHPLAGEKIYSKLESTNLDAPRQALHSHRLKFIHPITNDAIEFTSPMPKDISAWLKRIQR
jgi:23S rRNA pseudouridine1911/1915/1917 synthase